ncbi:hypothetical protein WOLCODRAFT_157262 [Wolfiporia cocos MD-104 SS10]|uniref:Uncharacterized protein n=1 Tax=Wolfiporia cocos (strain MD-104) TaxID=742152 RepID=A0A2H3J2S7_WOLCO|nr:hypothetical protein WOLCODRAFT_157262 [Wolfiporia cocos MD-104 SS10]
MLAGNLPRTIERLSLRDGEWHAGIPQTVFLPLSAFTSFRRLTLDDVIFPSMTDSSAHLRHAKRPLVPRLGLRNEQGAGEQ